MTRKHRRLVVVLSCMAGVGTAAGLTLNAFRDSVVFFMTPADLTEKAPLPGQTVRLGGMVEKGSLHQVTVNGAPTADFRVTDGKDSVEVSYTGILPDLFREGQGVVTLGALLPDHTFRAEEVLAKHDETYMPKDVADALKKRGYWKPGAKAAGS